MVHFRCVNYFTNITVLLTYLYLRTLFRGSGVRVHIVQSIDLVQGHIPEEGRSLSENHLLMWVMSHAQIRDFDLLFRINRKLCRGTANYILLATDRQSEGQTDTFHHFIMPLSYGGQGIKQFAAGLQQTMKHSLTHRFSKTGQFFLYKFNYQITNRNLQSSLAYAYGKQQQLTVSTRHADVNAATMLVDILSLTLGHTCRHRINRQIVEFRIAALAPRRRHVRYLQYHHITHLHLFLLMIKPTWLYNRLPQILLTTEFTDISFDSE